MLVYCIKRIVLGIGIMFVISLSMFTLTNVAVDPAIAVAGHGASAADVEAARKRFGFDRPIVVRYGEWLTNAVSGDLGLSFIQQRPVTQIIMERLPVTAQLAFMALIFSLALSLPLAMAAAVKPGSWVDAFVNIVGYIAQSMPMFWVALLGMLVFSVQLAWLPVSGFSSFENFILPAAVLGFYSMPTLLRLTRTGLIEVLSSDYIRTAKAKGLRLWTILIRHALRNAIIPVVSVASVQFGYMLAGSVLVETIFAMHGIGYLAWDSVLTSDQPLLQAIVLVTSLFYVLLTLLSDILNAWLDPRLRAR